MMLIRKSFIFLTFHIDVLIHIHYRREMHIFKECINYSEERYRIKLSSAKAEGIQDSP
jgi:hypothetical protein